MKIVDVVVVGYGHLGKWHCQKVDDLHSSKLAYIVEPNEENAKQAKENHPHTNVVKNLSECINDIHAGLVITPTSFHHQVSKELLENKKHVFCEKPLTSTASESLELEGLASIHDVVLQVGHSERCHQVWELRDLFNKFIPGSSIIINRFAPFKGRATDVDVVKDLMIHDIDLLFYVTGSYPIKVISHGQKIRTDKWDCVSSTFIFENGISAVINVGRNNCHEKRDVSLINEKGSFFVNLLESSYSISSNEVAGGDDFVSTFEYPKRDHLLIEQEKFYDSILNKTETFVSASEGRRAVQIVEAVLRSLETPLEAIQID